MARGPGHAHHGLCRVGAPRGPRNEPGRTDLVGSHDTTWIRTLVGADPRLVDVAAGLLLTMPGIPMITYGDELGKAGEWGEDGRRPMPWEPQQWDVRLREVYRSLIALRSRSSALRHGGLRWVYADDDAIVYLREAPDEVALVHCARSAHDPVHLDARRLGNVSVGAGAFGRNVQVADGRVTISAEGPSVDIWIFPPGPSGAPEEH